MMGIEGGRCNEVGECAGRGKVLQIKDITVLISVPESSSEKAENGLVCEHGKHR
jgi:hypothetical protein